MSSRKSGLSLTTVMRERISVGRRPLTVTECTTADLRLGPFTVAGELTRMSGASGAPPGPDSPRVRSSPFTCSSAA
jgi:hypothetical protein